MYTYKKTKGFTLVELLVVIAIIGILSSVVFASLQSARAKARDARRVSDVDQIKLALELYYDANGQYPASGGAATPNSSWSNSNDSSWTTLQTFLQPYLSKLPTDPSQVAGSVFGTNTYSYFSLGYGCNQQWYMLVYALENASGPDPGVTACDGTNFKYGGAGASTQAKTVGVKNQ